MKKILNKLRSRKGESISEVLVALLIAAVAVLLLACMVSTSVSLIRESRNKMDAYYSQNNALSTMTGATEGTVTLDQALTPTTGSTVAVDILTNDKLGTNTVTAYRKR